MVGRSAASARAFLAATFVLAAHAAAAAPPTSATASTALAALRPGAWQIRALGTGGPPRQRLCVTDAAALIQLRHGAIACTRFVIADNSRDAVVHYSCPGAGWGRTSLRVASDARLQIETQGIADSAPFAFKAEALRTGACRQRRAFVGR